MEKASFSYAYPYAYCWPLAPLAFREQAFLQERLPNNTGWFKQQRSQNHVTNTLPFIALLLSIQVLVDIIIIIAPWVPSVPEQRLIHTHFQRGSLTDELTITRHIKYGRHKETLLPLYTWATMAEGCQVIYSWIRSWDINASAFYSIVPLKKRYIWCSSTHALRASQLIWKVASLHNQLHHNKFSWIIHGLPPRRSKKIKKKKEKNSATWTLSSEFSNYDSEGAKKANEKRKCFSVTRFQCQAVC